MHRVYTIEYVMKPGGEEGWRGGGRRTRQNEKEREGDRGREGERGAERREIRVGLTPKQGRPREREGTARSVQQERDDDDLIPACFLEGVHMVF